MEFDLCTGITVRSGTVNAVLAPEELAVTAIAGHNEFRRFRILCVSSPSSRLVTGIRNASPNFDARTAGTAAELKGILEAASHTVIFVEHNPAWYVRHEEMLPLVSHVLLGRARHALVILYTCEPDRTFDLLCRKADRVFFIVLPPVPVRHAARHRITGSREALFRACQQRTLEVT